MFTEVFQPGLTVSPEDQRSEIENIVNSAHLELNGVLRCSIALGDSSNRTHLFVF